MTSTGASVQLTGLAANTLYDVYVQADCGGSGTSGWSNVATAQTACGSETAPWFDDFESYSTGTADRFGCWTQDQSSSNPRWYADNGGTPSGSTGPSVDNTTGSSSGIYMFFESSSPAALGDTNSLLSPMIDVTALTTPYLEFYYHMFGSSMGNLHVDVYDDINGWQRDVILLSGQQQTSSTAPYDKAAAILTTGASSVQIRFRGERGSSFYGDKAIDDVSISEAPSCFAPAGLSASNILSTGFDVSWTSTDTDFNVEYGPSGYAQGTGAAFSVTGATSVTINGQGTTTAIMPNTSYDVYVQTNCGSSTSSWVGPITVTTLCAPFSMPYTEGFDGTTWPPTCWDMDNGTFSPVQYGNDYMEASFWTYSSGSVAYAVSPVITLTADARATFAWSHLYSSTYSGDQLILRVKEAGTSNWDTIKNLQGPSFDAPGAGNTTPAATFIPEVMNLDVSLTGKDVVFEFVFNSGWGPDCFVDDFVVEAVPNCLEPSNLVASAITDTSFDISWTSADTDFNVEYGPAGFGQGTGATFSVSGATSTGIYGQGSTTVGLDPNTSYDVYVQTNCGSSTSSWTGPITVTTLCSPAAMPYVEGFDGTTWPPTCWDLDNGTFTPVQYGNDYMEASFWSFSAGNVAYAVSPTIDIANDARVKFSWAHAYSTAYPNDALTLRVAEAGTSNWDTLQYLQGANFDSPNAQNTAPPLGGDADFINEIIILDPSYTGKDVVFEFVFASGWGPDCFIDDFIVEKVPDCPEPGALSASQIIGTSAMITWAAANNAVDYNVEYGPSGFAQGTGTIITTPDTFTVLSGLTTTTSYDVYVQTNCTSDNSVWQGPITFTTTVSCPAPVLTNAFVWPNQIQFFWTPNISASYVQWAIIPNGTPITAAVLNTDTNSGSARDSSLTPSTAYTVWLRDSCGPGDVSAWASWNITTSCAPTVAPYFDDYDLFTSASLGIIGSDNCWWWNQNYTGGPFWRTISGGTASSNTGPLAGSGGSGQYMYLETSTGPGSSEVWSPDLDISGMSNPELSFEYHMYGATMGTMQVSVVADTLNTVIWSISGQQQEFTI